MPEVDFFFFKNKGFMWKKLNHTYFYRKMYQDYITQYKEVLKQHREKYTESPLAQEYYKKKKELEEIRNRVLRLSEKYTLKEESCVDVLGTTIISAFIAGTIVSALHFKSAVKSSN